MTLPLRLRASLMLAVIAVVLVVISALSNGYTKPRIVANERDAAMRQINQIVPRARYDNRPANDFVVVSDPDLLGGSGTRRAFRAFHGGVPVAVILETVAPNGYSGPIRLLVGINADGRVAGVRVTAHRETKGLGDRIELAHSDWILGFDDHALGAPDEARWRVRRDGGDFDQFTGATVTPAAVVQAVRDALLYFRQHADELLSAPPAKPDP
jgi:electron transport complex protein RnfG